MSIRKFGTGLLSPSRRKLLAGMAALPAVSLLPKAVWAAAPPTAAVNTTGLAVTDTTVKIGILHSIFESWVRALEKLSRADG